MKTTAPSTTTHHQCGPLFIASTFIPNTDYARISDSKDGIIRGGITATNINGRNMNYRPYQQRYVRLKCTDSYRDPTEAFHAHPHDLRRARLINRNQIKFLSAVIST